MKKPQLCLSLTISLALLQANILQVSASPSSPAIWEKLAGVKSSNIHSSSSKKPVKKKSVIAHGHNIHHNLARRNVISTVASNASTSGQVLLFFGKNNQPADSAAPATVLTIHSPLSEQTVASSDVETVSPEKPKLLSLTSTTKHLATSSSEVTTASHKKEALAQLAPDQLLAQETSQTPIPPVVAGTVDLEEFKPSNSIDLKVSQSRTFKLRNKIIRTSISDPSIAEPVVVAENQMVLLGKAPGGTTLVIWDDAGNSIAIDIKVSRDYSSLQAMLREVDPRIIVKPFSVGGADRVVLMGDVDHPESIIRAFAVANAFMDDRGMNITVANSRVMGQRPGDSGTQQMGGMMGQAGGGGGQMGSLSAISQVDRYMFFSNQTSNISKAQTILSDGGRVTSLIQVRKTPLIILHVTFMEMNSSAVRELGLQLGIGFSSQSFAFGIGGNPQVSTGNNNFLTSLPGVNGTFGTAQNPYYGGSLASAGLGNAINTNFGGTGSLFPGGLAGVTGGSTGTVTTSGGAAVATNIPGGTPGINTAGGRSFFIPAGINPFFGGSTAPVNFFGGNNVANGSNLGLGVINAIPSLLTGQSLFGAPGATGFVPNDLANIYSAISNFATGQAARWSLNPTVQGSIGYSRARILAEPTLVTISGERAAYLAGGEIPILQSIATAGTAAQSIVFEPYGLRINMIPVLMENGIINLQVAPEERLLDYSTAFNLPNQAPGAPPSSIPGFTTRKTQTIVELKPGQELFISGLVSQNTGRTLQKTPILGEIPVLGALYRSKSFAKNESELIVSVRPEVILPGTPGQLKIPAELNNVEAHRDLNVLQVEPSVIDESHYTSGMSADKGFQAPNTLPMGAEVPDNK